MRPMRIRWLGPERRRQLLDVLQTQVRCWAEEWSIAPDGFKVELPDDNRIPNGIGWRWQRADSAAGALHLGLPLPILDALGGLLAQTAIEDRLGLGRRVAEHALQSLVARLAGDGTIVLVASDMPSASAREARFGGLCIHLAGKGFHAVLWLDSGVCDALCPPPHRDQVPLHQKAAALGPETMTLDVVVDLGSATVNDTNGLRVGEVLVSRTPLKSLFHLVAPDGRRIACGSPCKNGDSLAVQIESA